MKSKHRHELKTNDLAEWIANFPQWARENRRMFIYASVVLVVVIALVFVRWYPRKAESLQKQLEFTNIITGLSRGKRQIIEAQARGLDISYMLLQIADELQAAAQNTKDDAVAAFALIKKAEALRAELHYRLGTVDRQNLIDQINRAKVSCTEAISRLTGYGAQGTINPTLMATAKFGLGLCEEELGNFEKAEQIYQDIAANPQFECTTAAAAAKQRLETMADYQRKVVFKASPKPVPTELIQPQIQLIPTDINLPLR